MSNISIIAPGGGQFGWFSKIGATNEAVNTLNAAPGLFTILVVVLISITAECLFMWYIHYATLKPEQKKKKDAGKPAAKKLPFLRT